MDLSIYRKEIDRIDAQMRVLFEERMRVVEKIALAKREANAPIFQPLREAEIIERAGSLVAPDLKELYVKYVQNMMDLSKSHQIDTLKQK